MGGCVSRDNWGTWMEGWHSQREWARGQWVRRWLAEGPLALPLPTCELGRFPPEHSGPRFLLPIEGRS